MKKKEKQPDMSGIKVSLDTAKDPWILGIITLTVVAAVVLSFARYESFGQNPVGKAYAQGQDFDIISNDLRVQGSVMVAGEKMLPCNPGTIVFYENAYWGCVLEEQGTSWKRLDTQ